MSDDDKVVGIFDKPTKEKKEGDELDFEATIRKNKENKERIAKEREAHNKKLTRNLKK